MKPKEGKKKDRKKIKLFTCKKVILFNMGRSLVGVRDQLLQIKNSNVILPFSLMCNDLL